MAPALPSFLPAAAPRLAATVLFAMLAGVFVPKRAHAQTLLYWDTNGTSAGAGGSGGTWTTNNGASNRNWNTNSAGTTSTPTSWVAGSAAVFSAGSDTTGAYTITVSNTQSLASLTVEEGSPTFSGGVLNFTSNTPTIVVAPSSTATFASGLSSTNALTLAGGGTAALGASLTFSGELRISGGTLALAGYSLSVTTFRITGNTILDFGNNLASTLSASTFIIDAGVTLTIQQWVHDIDHFYATTWSGATLDAVNAAPMNQVSFSGFDSNQTGWDSFDRQIRPIPEPGTYGLALVGLGTALVVARRLRRRS